MSNIDHYLFELNKYRNVTQTAKVLNISQPALSSSLSALEARLGYQIFDRTSTPIVLTPEGTIYLEYLRQKKILETDLSNQIEQIHNNKLINITIGAPSIYLSTYLFPIMNNLVSKYPLCHFRLVEGTIDKLSSLCQNGDIDIYISTEKSEITSINCIPFITEQLYMYIHTELVPTNICNPINELNALSHIPFIVLGNNQPLQKSINMFFTANHFTPKHIIEVDQIASALELAKQGCGICFAPKKSTIHYSDCLIKTYPLPANYHSRDIYIAFHKQKQLNDIHKYVINTICQKHII